MKQKKTDSEKGIHISNKVNEEKKNMMQNTKDDKDKFGNMANACAYYAHTETRFSVCARITFFGML